MEQELVLNANKKQHKPIKLKKKTREGLIGYLFASLWFIGIFGFTLFPLLTSLFYSLTDYNLKDTPNMVWFNNYVYILVKDTMFWKSLGNYILPSNIWYCFLNCYRYSCSVYIK